ncbi:MAG: LacI family DNA-binding transcriptional regulator [Lachnospiraceae bacterium]|nr:LacI family DNA-binding transcriptional regulator [Lachnospiraceae bacterium]
MEDLNKTLTIDDIAKELGISKTTVSRSISGKGRIGAATRKKVLDYIDAVNFRPNPQARGLAQSRSYNIGWVIPGDTELSSLSFFQRCMQGVIDVAAKNDSDVLISAVSGNNISGLKRIVENQKVDGVILGQSLNRDPAIAFLKERNLPFVVVGSTDVEGVVQVDNDHLAACCELSSIIRMKNVRFVTLIGGDRGKVVNETRRKGFEAGIGAVKHNEYVNCKNVADIERAVEAALTEGVDCIICEDDYICFYVMSKLRRDGVDIPGRVKVASFYNSRMLEGIQPAVTALQYDPQELGEKACSVLLDMIAGKEVPHRTLLGYEVVLKASTQ